MSFPNQSGFTFQLTTSQGGRPSQDWKAGTKPVFQLTTSQGGRRFTLGTCQLELYFNSRPHKEVDETATVLYFEPLSISTHDLTRRSTLVVEVVQQFQMAFQLTTSQGGRRVFLLLYHVIVNISTHDLTRRSTKSQKAIKGVLVISTHDLTRRSTLCFYVLFLVKKFQLTTSQGGRPGIESEKSDYYNFNSRPHKEVD